MKKLFVVVFICLKCFIGTAQTNCENALIITDGIHNANFLPGGQLPQQICFNSIPSSPTLGVWFMFIPDSDHTVSLTTNIQGIPQRDTRLNVFSGSCDTLQCVTGDDDGGGNYASSVSFNVTEGTTYYIVFDNGNDSSDFYFKLSEHDSETHLFTPQALNLTSMTSWCIADMNGDFLDDVVGVNYDSVDILFQDNTRAGFTHVNYITPFTNIPSWSISAGDYDKNGFNDLLLCGSSGASIVLANSDGTGFSSVLESPEFIYSQRSNFVDINKDGNLDAFVCHDIAPNVYFQNDGNSGFTYHQGGVGDYPSGGNYGSIWVDYDNDGDIDLFIAKCRGGDDMAAVDELHRNNGDGTFTNVAEQAGLADLHQSWSSAWGDYNNDGFMETVDVIVLDTL